jgi:catechol 2,3-dioxygenase-like lactoylglutathione lyase family enzyme
MPARIDLITILSDDPARLAEFYQTVMEFTLVTHQGDYFEFASEGVRFSICSKAIMYEATGHTSYLEKAIGQHFELAFPVDTPAQVDELYTAIVEKGATPVTSPENMPWGQRAAFFADPDGNIHEIFAALPSEN